MDSLRLISDLIRTKLPRVISNRSGVFRTALLHTSPPESVLSVQISKDGLVRKPTKNPA